MNFQDAAQQVPESGSWWTTMEFRPDWAERVRFASGMSFENVPFLPSKVSVFLELRVFYRDFRMQQRASDWIPFVYFTFVHSYISICKFLLFIVFAVGFLSCTLRISSDVIELLMQLPP